MTRTVEIATLRARYKQAISERKWKTATLIYVRLRYLVKQQLKSENRRKVA
ncbi:MAG: hypothetical protein KGL39_20160 [Patescibacteria group bacterium]|nr:hypothetical protein [Patescibacteria group bacterium]